MDTEKWLPLPGWESLYQISNFGCIQSARFKNGTYPGKPLRRYLKRNGYLQACLCRSGKETYKGIHQLVALAFLPPPKPGQTTVNHKNGVKTDNRAANLEWASPRQNVQHSIAVLGHATHGEAAGMAKLTEEQVLEIRALHKESGLGYGRIAPLFNINRITVRDIVKRRTWKHLDDSVAMTNQIDRARRA